MFQVQSVLSSTDSIDTDNINKTNTNHIHSNILTMEQDIQEGPKAGLGGLKIKRSTCIQNVLFKHVYHAFNGGPTTVSGGIFG